MSEAKEPAWETIATSVQRLPIDGGWLYAVDSGDGENVVFVPDPSLWAEALAIIAARLDTISIDLGTLADKLDE